LTLASDTDGVKQVVDNLDVEVAGPPPPHSVNGGTPGAAATTGRAPAPGSTPVPVAASDDTRITMSIQSKYFMDDRIKARHIVVATNAGVVTLNGEIADETERAEALLLARTTEGVKRVEDNLTIASASAAPASAPTSAAPASAPPTAPTQATPAAPPAAGKSTAAAPDTDTGLADRIKSQLTSDTQMKNAPIEVTAKSGVVTLQGTVPTNAAKAHALTAVSGIDGVRQVVDRIQVSTATSSPTKSLPARKAKR